MQWDKLVDVFVWQGREHGLRNTSIYTCLLSAFIEVGWYTDDATITVWVLLASLSNTFFYLLARLDWIRHVDAHQDQFKKSFFASACLLILSHEHVDESLAGIGYMDFNLKVTINKRLHLLNAQVICVYNYYFRFAITFHWQLLRCFAWTARPIMLLSWPKAHFQILKFNVILHHTHVSLPSLVLALEIVIFNFIFKNRFHNLTWLIIAY